MKCPEIRERLSAFVDGDVTVEERRAFVSHFDGCAACRLLARDLERLRAAARELGPIDPPEHVWLEVAGQIHLGGPRQLKPVAATPAKRPPLRQYLSVAAALVLVAGGVYIADRFSQTPDAPAETATVASGPAAAVMDTVNEELDAALTHYDSAMSQLQQLASSGHAALDPQVATALQDNLRLIDEAIAESRKALDENPQSAPARASLIDALRHKVLMLKTTVELMNEMPQDRQDGGARSAPANGRKS